MTQCKTSSNYVVTKLCANLIMFQKMVCIANKTPDGHTNKKPQKDKTMVNNNFLVGENNALPSSFFFVFCSCIHVSVINCAYNWK